MPRCGSRSATTRSSTAPCDRCTASTTASTVRWRPSARWRTRRLGPAPTRRTTRRCCCGCGRRWSTRPRRRARGGCALRPGRGGGVLHRDAVDGLVPRYPPRTLPADRAAFARYLERTLDDERLGSSEVSRHVARQVLWFSHWSVPPTAVWLQRVLAFATLDPRVVRRLDLRPGRADIEAGRRLDHWLSSHYRRLPRIPARLPALYVRLRRPSIGSPSSCGRCPPSSGRKGCSRAAGRCGPASCIAAVGDLPYRSPGGVASRRDQAARAPTRAVRCPMLDRTSTVKRLCP